MGQMLQFCTEGDTCRTIKVDEVLRLNPLQSQHFEKMTSQILYAFYFSLLILTRHSYELKYICVQNSSLPAAPSSVQTGNQ